MVLENKKLTFYINNQAYVVDIGLDINKEVEDGLKRFVNLDKNITTSELLLAYLRKTQEHIYFKKNIENQIENLKDFEQTKIR